MAVANLQILSAADGYGLVIGLGVGFTVVIKRVYLSAGTVIHSTNWEGKLPFRSFKVTFVL